MTTYLVEDRRPGGYPNELRSHWPELPAIKMGFLGLDWNWL